jgi:hypothetical protein
MKIKNTSLFIFVLIVSSLLIFSTCDKKEENPFEPPPVDGTAVLELNYTFTGAVLTTATPLVIHVYDNKFSLTNQSNPKYVHTTTNANDMVTINDIPPGTYYILIYHEQFNLGFLDQCSELFVIYTDFNWWQGQPVNATPLTITKGETVTLDMILDSGAFYTWAPGGC